jgi:hypothetical protein
MVQRQRTIRAAFTFVQVIMARDLQRRPVDIRDPFTPAVQ